MILEVTAVPYTTNHRGGGESFPWYLSEQLHFLEPTVFAYAQENRPEGLPSYHLVLPARFLDFPPLITRHNPLPTTETLRTARSFLSEHLDELDFIHVHNLRTAMSTMWLFLAHRLQSRSKFRILLTDHGSRWFPLPSLTVSWADAFLPVSSASRDQLLQLAHKPSWTLPVGVPPGYPGLHPPRNTNERRTIDVIFFGRLSAFKRPDLFLRLVSDLMKCGFPDLRAVLMGSPSGPHYWNYLLREIRRYDLGKRLRVVLNPSTEEAARILADARLNILLSNQVPEGGIQRVASELAPSTVLEAGSCGTPTLASTFRGVEDVIRPNETGIIVDTRRWSSVIGAASRLLRDESQWEALSNGVWQFVRRERTYDHIARELQAFLNRLRQGGS